jgi:hypothetical protein
VKRAVIIAASLVVAVCLFLLAFLLGARYFNFRRHHVHETRLQRMLVKNPTLDQVTEGLRNEGSLLIEAPRDARELEPVVQRLGGEKKDEILEKGRSWETTRVFRAGDMLYFLFFDGNGVLRDFSFVSG